MAESMKPSDPRLTVESVAIGELRSDPRNARIHPERNLEAIAASLRRFGQQKPIVALRDGTVIAGNGTLEAARRLGWKTLEVVRTRLEEAEAVAFALADNRTAELAAWDFDALRAALAETGAETDDGDLGSMFADLDFGASGGAGSPLEAPTEFKLLDESLPTEYRCPRCSYEWSGAPNPNATGAVEIEPEEIETESDDDRA